MATPRAHHTLTLLPDEKVLAAGGGNNPAIAAEIHNPATDTWSNCGVMPTPVLEHTATLLADGSVLLSGGRTIGELMPSREAWLYDPVTTNWSLDTSMWETRFKHSAVRLQDGKVLVTGGRVDSPTWFRKAWVRSAEIRGPMPINFNIYGTIRQGGPTGSVVRGATVSGAPIQRRPAFALLQKTRFADLQITSPTPPLL